MQGLSANAPGAVALAPGVAANAMAGPRVAITGDGTSRSLEVDAATFEDLVTAIEMRPHAFETTTHTLRPHRVKAIGVVQKLDRLWTRIEAAGRLNPALVPAAERLRDMAELSDTVGWSRA